MSTKTNTRSNHSIPTFRGRNMGIAALVATQYLIGALHLSVGLWLLGSDPDVYGSYTLTYSIFTILFSYALWKENRWGWISTTAVSVFVITVDMLAIADFPNILEIPKFAGLGEIPYCAIVILYLVQPHIRAKYCISK